MKAFGRRSFLKIAGVAAAGAAGASLGRAERPLPEIGDPWPNADERRVASVCQLCPGGCGVLARVVDERLVKVEGNPLHPVNQGRLCPLGHAAPQLFHHPDRLRSPMLRDGSGALRPVSWEIAIALLAKKLGALRDRGEAHSAAFLAGPYRGLRERFLRRFMDAYGSPNYIRAREGDPETPDPAHVLTQGADRPLAPDLFEARSILSFGMPLLEGGPSPVHQMRAYGHFRQGEGRERGILIQIEPRKSATAARADKWVSLRPGTETDLALGIAHVLIFENLIDERFIERHCEGYVDSTGSGGETIPGFRSLVLRRFTLPRVSRTTGVPVETILGVARAFASAQPGVAIGPGGFPNGPARLGLRLAVHYLNALVGNIGKKGGMFIQGDLPLGRWEAPQLDAAAKRSAARPRLDGAGEGLYFLAGDVSENLPERIRLGKPYPLKVLLVAGWDPLFGHPRSREFEKAIERVPFLVSFSSMPDAITARAHLVLPDAVYLERWCEDGITHLGGVSAFSVGRPALRTKDSPPGLEDVLLRVAKKIGGTVAESFEWDTFADAIFEAAAPLAGAGRGYVVSDEANERFRAILTRQGYWQKEFEDADEFWEKLIEKGAWWDAGDEVRGVQAQLLHPSRKFQFFPARLEGALAGMPPDLRKKAKEALGLESVEGRLIPASPEAKRRRSDELDLILFRPMALAGPVAAELPWMMEQLASHAGSRWDSWAEIHPADARRLGVREGDLIELRSGAASIQTHARLFKGIRRGAVAMPLGLGRVEGGRWAKGRGADPMALVRALPDPIHGMGAVDAAPVRIRRAG